MRQPTFLSAFAGIGGFDLGLERAGWRSVGQIEINDFCTRVLARHWPDVPRWGDIQTVSGEPERGAIRERGGGAAALRPDHELPVRGAIDLLCGGFPCQDLSVAGRRAGLAGARSGLFFEFVRLAAELRPRWLLLENVPGLLSSNGGDDFRIVLAALGDAGYGVGWRVLDARWFGVPQRRRRVFLVGHLGGPCPPAVLVEPEGVLGHPAPRGDAGAELAHCLRGGTQGGRTSDDPDRVSYALTAPGRKGVAHPTTDNYVPELSPALRAEGHDASEDGNGRRALVVNGNSTPEVGDDLALPLRNNDGSGNRQALAFAWQQGDDSPHTGSGRGRSWVARAGDYTGALSTTRHDAVSIAAPLTSGGHPNSNAPGRRKEDDINLAAVGSAVRRLTPTECERLQAFPDGWTCLCGVEPYSTWDCRCPDGPRYAALGNAVTVNVITWLGKRILAAHNEPNA